MSLVEIENLSFSYENEITLENINLKINENENIALVGKNGGGKSTLVKIILNYGKKFRYKGKIKYNIPIDMMSYLPQVAEFYKNFPISVFEVVISGLANKKNLFRSWSKDEKEKTLKILSEFNILEVKDKKIKDISGGQLQRALLARALISDKKLIFLDEPETYLDYNFFVEILKKFSKKNKTIVVITHELGSIRPFIDKVYAVETVIKKEPKEHFHTCGCDIS